VKKKKMLIKKKINKNKGYIRNTKIQFDTLDERNPT
jgi:hypothetical protein